MPLIYFSLSKNKRFDKNLKDLYQYIPILYKYEFDKNIYFKLYISTVGWLKTYYAHVLKTKNLCHPSRMFHFNSISN